MAAVLRLNSDFVPQSKRRVAWGSNDWLEDERCFCGGGALFAAHVGLLFTATIFRRGRCSRGFRPLGWCPTLAFRAFHHPSWIGLLSGLSRDALPGASKQDCYRFAGSSDSRCSSSSSVSSSHCQRACRYFEQTTMKQRLSILTVAVVVAGLLALGWHFYGGEKVPAGQPPLVSLTSSNFDQLRTAFNGASGDVRIVLLLSPT
jgi:hypothetical protein